MKDLTPRPTEYRGVTYRSKCEAMFARWLDHQYCPETQLIQYEPTWASCGEYVPDFLTQSPVMLHHRDNNHIAKFATCIELIEYKPSMPTITYCNTVMKKLKTVADRELAHIDEVTEILLSVYFGSVYTNDRGVFRVNPVGGCRQPIAMNWLTIYEKQIREYRFDLESEVNNGR